jgi:hypothetical protein
LQRVKGRLEGEVFIARPLQKKTDYRESAVFLKKTKKLWISKKIINPYYQKITGNKIIYVLTERIKIFKYSRALLII